MPDASSSLSLAYLVSAYPGTSHTFISREVAALRELGVNLDTFSIKPATEAELEDRMLRQQADTTFTVRRQSAASFLLAQLATLILRPGRYIATLGQALAHRPPGLRAFYMAFVYFAESLVLARELDRRGVTHLHNHFANAGAITGYLAAELLRIPWSFTMHGISETDYPAGLLLGKKIEAAAFVVCVSYFGRAQAMRVVTPDHWKKLHVVRCGLPLARVPAHTGSNRRKRIISVGRLSPEKGQAGLIEAFASVASEFKDAELVFVGDGPAAQDLRVRAAGTAVADRISFLGRLGEEETLEQIAGSEILVLSSFMEGLPIVLLEAMAVGTAVIATRVAGIPELVEDAKSGLLFTPSKWDELAACLRRLLRDETLRGELAENGQEEVASEFNIMRSAQDLRTLFKGKAS